MKPRIVTGLPCFVSVVPKFKGKAKNPADPVLGPGTYEIPNRNVWKGKVRHKKEMSNELPAKLESV